MREWMGGSEVLPGSGGLAGRVPDPGGTAPRNGVSRAFSPGRLDEVYLGLRPQAIDSRAFGAFVRG